MRISCVLFALALASLLQGADTVGAIEYFGFGGIDPAAVRQAIALREGSVFDDSARRKLQDAVKLLTGGNPTDLASPCCDPQGRVTVYIGLPGKSTRAFPLNPKPSGNSRLPADFLALNERLDDAIEAAVRKGGDAPAEDDSDGYALIHDPPARRIQLQLRDYARAHESSLYEVLEHSSLAAHRARAANAIGYANRSPRQIVALLRASHDEDAGVRDEATRALGVLLGADPALAKQVSADDFMEMAWSGVWMDRNKASVVLEALTRTRDPQLLARIESQAWEPLYEMAQWNTGHAFFPRLILGRIRGVPDAQLVPLAIGPPQAFLAAIRR